jgi:hypothetical protein
MNAPNTGNSILTLVSASKSRGGEWSPDDYDVRDKAGRVVGRIMRHPQARKTRLGSGRSRPQMPGIAATRGPVRRRWRSL